MKKNVSITFQREFESMKETIERKWRNKSRVGYVYVVGRQLSVFNRDDVLLTLIAQLQPNR